MLRYFVTDDTLDTIQIDDNKSYRFKKYRRNLQKGEYFRYDVKPKDRLDLISFNMYGNPLYWFILANVNPTIDIWELKEGDILNIPYPQYMRNYV